MSEDYGKKVKFRIPLDIDWAVPEWMQCPVDGYRHIEFELRHADDEKCDELRAMATEVTFDNRKRVESINEDLYVTELFKYGLVKWRGADGECTDEAKLNFMRRHRKAATWAMTLISDGIEIAKVKMERLEAEKKISATGCGPDSITQS